MGAAHQSLLLPEEEVLDCEVVVRASRQVGLLLGIDAWAPHF